MKTHFQNISIVHLFAIRCLLAACLFPIVSNHLVAQEESRTPESTKDDNSSKSEKAPRKQLEYSKWTKTLNVPDPVAISFDNQGRAYVTQTTRRKANDLDIRNNRDWIPNDLSFQSVDEKLNFYRTRIAIELSKQNKKRVADLNNDGSHDFRDLTVLSEKIFRIEDSNGDGFADTSKLFADGFNTEVTGIAAGVLHFNDTVYATIAPDVWKLKDANGDGVADSRSKLATGFGLHIAYAGHDMHGLTVGPDGKVYWSIGDKGVSVTSKEGKRFHYPNQGCVLRCDPDGSNFEVYAHGLRNVQELAFDQYGNLFGVDNDADQPGERERYVYIVPGMDAGWRCHYQYRGNKFNPWTDEKLWQTYHSGQPAYITPPLKYGPNGPAGFAFNPGTALNESYKNYFFFTGAPHGDQFAFKVESDGASFKIIDEHRVGKGVAIVGINFGPDGALYGVDWANGYPLNQKGAIWKIDDPDAAKSAIRTETKRLLSAGFQSLDTSELSILLGHADQRVRLGAQFELVKRKEFTELRKIATTVKHDQLRRIHSIWGMGQLVRSGQQFNDWKMLLQDNDPEIQVQTLKVISDLPSIDLDEILTPVIETANPRVQFQMLLAFGKHGAGKHFDRIKEIANRTPLTKTYLRHGLAIAMAGSKTELLAGLDDVLKNENEVLRLCAVVALRQLKSHQVAQFLNDENELIRTEAARAIHDDFSIEAAMPLLAKRLNSVRLESEPFMRRVINANFRIGGKENILRLLTFARNGFNPIQLRKLAVDHVGEWLSEQLLDRVTGRFRKIEADQRKLDSQTLKLVADQLGEIAASAESELVSSALKSVRDLKLELDEKFLNAIVFSPESGSEAKTEALLSLEKNESPLLEKAIDHALKSKNEGLFLTSLKLLCEIEPSNAFVNWRRKYETTNKVRLKQKLIEIGLEGDIARIKIYLRKEFEATLEKLDSSPLALDLLETVSSDAKKNEVSAALLKRYDDLVAKREMKNALFKYAVAFNGGNVNRGKTIFNTNIDAQCVRCHRVGKTGSDVGPKLDGIAKKRDENHLLRAIVFPSADIEKEYKTVMVGLDSGKLLNGVKVKETDEILTIADNQGKTIKINKNEIEQIAEKKQSIMPDMTKSLSLREIRDLVAYLKSLK